jgi:hypothetical protein
MDSEEFSGEWWLPQRPERRVPGVLRIDAEGRATLSLIGELRDLFELGDVEHLDGGTRVTVTDRHVRAGGQYDRIHGQVGVTAYNLENCGQVHHNSNMMGGIPVERISVQQVFRGVLFEEGEEPCGDRVFGQLQWLSYWVGHGISVTEHLDPATRRLQGTTVALTLQPTQTVELHDGWQIRLHHGFHPSGDQVGSHAIHQEHWLEIASPTIVPMPSLIRPLHALQSLVGVGTGRPAGYEALRFHHPEVTEGPSQAYRRSLDYIAQWSLRDRETKPLQPHDVTFTLEDFGGIERLPSWIATAQKYEHPLNRALARQQRDMFVNDQVFNAAAALEGFDKIAHPNEELSLIRRLSRSAALGGDVFASVTPRTDTWAELLRNERNEIGHGGLGNLPPAQMFYLASSAFFLLEVCLLVDAGAPSMVLGKMRASERARWLRESLLDFLP